MSRKIIPLFAVLAMGIGGAAQAQTTTPIDTSDLTVKTLNPNVTKIDGTVSGIDVKAIQNPAQSNVKLKGPDGGKVMLKLKNGAPLEDAKIKVKQPK